MTATTRFDAPPLWMTFLESRAVAEYAGWRLSMPLLQRLPKGDGHPVLVLPGFTAADRSTVRLRILLRRLGYRTYGWRLGANIGPTPHIIDGLNDRIDKIRQDNDDQRISIVGWSLGGVFARLLARENPQHFRQVITLGSPFRMKPGDRSAVSALWESVSHLHDPSFLEPMLDPARPPLMVPATSIYTRTDGIVHWRSCLEERGPISENIEVYGSHSGLGFNPAAAIAVADRLAQQTGQWKHFRPPVWAVAAFPRAANWKPKSAGARIS